MSITVYTGLMGSGKSYEVVSQVIVPAIAAGRTVVTNVDGISETEIYAYLVERDPRLDRSLLGRVVHVDNEAVGSESFLPHYDDKRGVHIDTVVKPGDLVCVDEAWRFWGSDSKLLKQHKSFFLEHRHFTHEKTRVSCDLVLMVQDISTLHRFLRSVVAFNARTHKKVSLGLNRTYSVTMYEGSRQRASDQIGNWVRNYDAAIFPLYSSFKGGVDGKIVNADKRVNIFSSGRLWLFAGLWVVVAGVSTYYVYRFFRPSTSVPESAALSVPGQLPVKAGLPAGPVVSPLPSVPSVSSEWRYAGEVSGDGGRFAVSVSPEGRSRLDVPAVYSGHGLASVGLIDGKRVTSFSGSRPALPVEPKK